MRVTGEFRTPGWTAPAADNEVVVTEFFDGTIEIKDPLFEEPYRIGDGSIVLDPTAEKFMLAHWRYNALGLSTRQLTNTAEFTTKAESDRWSRMGHMLSVATLTGCYGGSPAQIMTAAIHDAPHRLGSHRTDDLMAGRGTEDAHDMVLDSYLTRNGFRDYLIELKLTDEEGNFLDHDGLNLDYVFGHDEATMPECFVNQPGRKQSLEVERLQYVAQEATIWMYDSSIVREAVDSAIRGNHTVHGEHLVFDSIDAARLIGIAQSRCITEHWGDPVNDVVDELLMTLDRRLLTNQKHVSDMNLDDKGYYPGDVMYTSEEDWVEKYEELAKFDAFSTAILKIAKTLAQQQREAHGNLSKDDSYVGPILPDYVRLDCTLSSGDVHTAQGVNKARGNYLSIQMLPGKLRQLDPWVIVKRGIWQRLSEADPTYAAYREKQSQWLATGPYDATIDFGHPSLNLTSSEKRAIGEGIKDIKRDWGAALNRPAMPDEVLQARVAEAALKTRERALTGSSIRATETRRLEDLA